MRAVMTERAEAEKLQGKAWGDTHVTGFGEANIFEKMVYYICQPETHLLLLNMQLGKHKSKQLLGNQSFMSIFPEVLSYIGTSIGIFRITNLNLSPKF